MPGAVVLGGNGFIGRHIADALVENGYTVLVVGRRPTTTTGHQWVSADLAQTSAENLASILSSVRPAVVVNAIGGVWSVTPEEMEAANFAVTSRLLSALSLLQPCPRLVQLGSVLEYGPVSPGQSVTADTPTHPVTPYGKTKLAATEAVLSSTMDALVLRLSNVVGPGVPQVSLLGQVATRLASAMRDGTEAVVELDPMRAQRDFVDVRDVAEAVVHAASASATGVVNIGRGEAVPVQTMVDLLISVSGVRVQVVERTPVPSGDAAPRGNLDWFQTDLAEATELLSWKPRHTLEETVRAFWHEFLTRTESGRPV